MKHIFAFIVASILIVAYSATVSAEDSSVSLDSVKDKHCECIDNDCGCCEHLKIDSFRINGLVCTNFTYLPQDYGISITVTYNTYTVINETVSARNPPPMCFGIPDLEKIQAHVCMRFYDLDFSNKHFHGCMKLSASIYHVIHKSVNVGCFNIPGEPGLDINAIEAFNWTEWAQKEGERLRSLMDQIPVVNMI